MTWIEVASDAIKIGLGALIAAVSAYVTARVNIRNESRKMFLTQKRDKLDKSLKILNSFHKKYTSYRADVANYYIRKRDGYTHSADEMAALDKSNEEFRTAFEGFVDVEGYLLSTGSLYSHSKLYEYMEVMSEVRNTLWFRQDDISEDFIDKLNEKVRSHRRDLLLALNKSYVPQT